LGGRGNGGFFAKVKAWTEKRVRRGQKSLKKKMSLLSRGGKCSGDPTIVERGNSRKGDRIYIQSNIWLQKKKVRILPEKNQAVEGREDQIRPGGRMVAAIEMGNLETQFRSQRGKTAGEKKKFQGEE